MRYIHELKKWPEFTWDDARLFALLAEVRHRQGWLLGRLEGLGFRFREEATLATLTEEVVKSSAIEGEKLDVKSVHSSLARRLGLDAGRTEPQDRHIEGIVEMMLDATRNCQATLTAKRLFGWHASLFPTGRSGMHKISVGKWRTDATGAMQVVSGAMGRERVHFEAPAATRLASEIKRFLAWFARPDVDPVLAAGIAHFWFITIHPFDDGNGRIARAIAEMALSRADGVTEKYYSMSAQIERERRDYYRRLETSQRSSTLDITDWLEWFLQCLSRAIERSQRTLDSVLQRAKFWERFGRAEGSGGGASEASLNERQRTVLQRLLDGFEGKLTTAKYAKLVRCSHDTALRDIKVLLDIGAMRQSRAAGRSTSYEIAL